MNRIYSLVWNRALRALQVASELARAHGGGDGAASAQSDVVRKALALAIAAALAVWMPAAFAGAANGTGSAQPDCISRSAVPVQCGMPGMSGQTGGGVAPLSVICGVPVHGGGSGITLASASGVRPDGCGGGGTSPPPPPPPPVGYGAGGAGGAGGGGYNGTAWNTSGAGAKGSAGGKGSSGTAGVGGSGGASDATSTLGVYYAMWYGGAGGAGAAGTGTSGGGGGGGGGAGDVWPYNPNPTTLSGAKSFGGAGSAGGAAPDAKAGAGSGGDGGTGLVLLGGTHTSFYSAGAYGGAGGAGGTSPGGIGGSGGYGGAGIVLGANSSLAISAPAVGGTGGAGGDGGTGGTQGVGGTGGYGAVLVSGDSVTIGAGGSIRGGDGGAGATAGTGGVGLVAFGGSSITDAGTIKGGLSGDGVTQADAIDFSGGGNTLVLESGYSLIGNVVSDSGTTNGGDTLVFGGSTDGTFAISALDETAPTSWTGTPQFYGFETYEKTGSSTWVLGGAPKNLVTVPGQHWLVTGGVLQVGDNTVGGAFYLPGVAGSPAVDVTGGALQVKSAGVSGFGYSGGASPNPGGAGNGFVAVELGSGTTLSTAAFTEVNNYGLNSSVYGGAGADSSAAGGHGGTAVSGTGFTFNNGGYILGGSGGGGATGGTGGAGVSGTGFTLNNSGHINSKYDASTFYDLIGGIGGGSFDTTKPGGDGGYGVGGSGFTVNNTGVIVGGRGGFNAGPQDGYNGGSGGDAITGSGFSVTNAKSGIIIGGLGYSGGYNKYGGRGGNGGNGGIGVDGSNFTLTNFGTITGGAAGYGGSSYNGQPGASGTAGVGVSSSGGATVVNEGTIGGGGGVPAIDFAGGGNTLELIAGTTHIFNGAIAVTRTAGEAADTFELGGNSGSDSLNISTLDAGTATSGFNAFEKTGGSTWTLTGSNTGEDWSITGGTLQIGNGTDVASLTGGPGAAPAIAATGGALVVAKNASVNGASASGKTGSDPGVNDGGAGGAADGGSGGGGGIFKARAVSALDAGMLALGGGVQPLYKSFGPPPSPPPPPPAGSGGTGGTGGYGAGLVQASDGSIGIAVDGSGGAGGGGGTGTGSGAGGAGGGGGGYAVAVAITGSSNAGSISGGAGAAGSAGATGSYSNGGGGGGGGGGGLGLLAEGAISFSNSGSISGGAGGAGGVGQNGGVDGGGGGGGAAVALTANGGVIGPTFTNTGPVTGGSGTGTGYGGEGIVSTGGATVINEGTISGGLDGDGTTREDAVDFTGGGNTLELVAGTSSTINGDISVTRASASDAADTLNLSGASGTGTFDISTLDAGTATSGFNAFEKSGGSTWTLTGSNTGEDWSITGGTLQVGTTATLASVTGPQGVDGISPASPSGAALAEGGAGGTAFTVDGGATLSVTAGSSAIGGTGGNAGNLAPLVINPGATGGVGGDAIDGEGPTATIDNAGSITGGIGGVGGLGGATSGSGGTGGDGVGGSGFVLTNAAYASIRGGAGGVANVNQGWASEPGGAGGFGVGSTTGAFQLTNAGIITGGTGAAGVDTTYGGGGGAGGAGVYGGGFTLTNTGTIAGGQGGAAKPPPNAAANGLGGAGVYSTGGATVINEGTISGGLDGDGTTREDAIDFTGGGNTLELIAGKTATFNGGISVTRVAGDAGDTLNLGGASGNGTFNVSSLGAVSATTGFNVLEKTGGSDWTLTGTGDARQNWSITGGGLIGDAGSIVGNVSLSGSLGSASSSVVEFNQTGTGTYAGDVSGTGYFYKDGVGTLTLTGDNTFTGGTTISSGTLQVGDYDAATQSGGTTGSLTGTITDNAALVFDRGNDVDFGGVLSGTGTLTQAGSGTLTLDGASGGFAGSTTVEAGSLIVGDDTHATAALGGDVTVDSGATLGGFGTLGSGSASLVEVKSGGILAPGDSIGTLNVDGDLTLDSGSLLDFEFGAPATSNVFTTAGASDSVSVNGNLALNGATLNVSNLNSAMGPGVYTLFSYTGTLSGAGCADNARGGSGSCVAFGTLPAGEALQLQYLSGAKQVNLIDSTGVALNFWDADDTASATQMGGGSGVWANNTANWTNSDGSAGKLVMSPQDGMAIFGGAFGTVTVSDAAADGGTVNSSGMQFMVDGYTLTGDTLTLVKDSTGNVPVINVGNGNSASAAFTATIDNVLAGTAGLTKTDWGTLVLSGANTFTGGLTVNGGTVEIAQGGTPGADDVTVDDTAKEGSTLAVDSGVARTNHIVLNSGAVLDNAGALSDTVDDMAVESDTGSVTVNNHDGGTITGKLFGVYLIDGGSVTNTGSGSTIASDRYGVVFDTSSASGTLTNGAGALIESTGTVDGNCTELGDCAVGIDDANVSVQNAGTIEGASGIQLVHGGSVTNEAGGVIEASGSATGDCNSTGDCAIGVVSVDGAGGALTLVNAGSIVGNVQMDPNVANATTLIAGGSIAGDLDIGTDAASTLTLDGANATPQLYSTAVTGTTTFDGALTKAGSGTWVIDSDLSSVAGTTISAGTLQIGNYAAATPSSGTTGSIGNANVIDNAVLVFDRSDVVTYSGVISGTGSLTQEGAGTLTLTGANTFTGGTTISAGLLKIGAGGGTGSIVGNIIDNGALIFDRTTKIAFAGDISGNGFLGENNSGWLTLNGDSSGFTGNVDVNNGGLIVGNVAGGDAKLGGNVTVTADTTLGGFGTVGGASDMVTLASGATLAPGNGAGSIGTLTVGGNFTAAQGSQFDFELGAPAAAPGTFTAFGAGDSLHVGGDLALNGATLNVANAGGMGPGLYNVLTYGGTLSETNGGLALDNTSGETLQVQNLTADKQINLIDSTGYLVKFWNANGEATATQMGGGDGTWSNASMEWTDATGIVTNEAMSPQPGFGVFGGAPGTVTVDDGAGAVQATGMQFAVDGYTLAGGTLTLVQNGAGVAPIINVGDGSAPSAGDTATIDNLLAGTAGLVKSDYGTLVLAGANTFTGGIALNGGTLSVANDANLGDVSNALTFAGGTLTNTAAFTSARAVDMTAAGTFDTQANLTLTGALSGSGALTKTGGATLIVDGDGGGFTGATDVKTGTLVVGDDSHAGAALGGVVTVAQGATLGGIGTIGGMNLSGTLSPGGSIGTLHVTGDATFQAGSTFSVEANPDGRADQLAAGGSVAIKGGNTLVIAQPGNWAPRTDYTIITAGQSVTGKFGSVSDDQAFLTPVLGYQANAVTLSLERNDISFQTIGGTANEQAAASGADALGWNSPVYNAVVTLDAPTARYAFDQLSGEYHASQQTARVEDSRYIREAMNQRLRSGDHDTQAQKVGDTHLTAWAHAWGHWGTTDSDGNAGKLADNGDGLLIGADMPVGTQGRIGITGGASRDSLSIDSRNSWGRETSTWLGAFAGYDAGAFGLRGGVAYAWDRVPSNRTVAFPGYIDHLGSNASGDTLTGFVEGAWTFHFAQGSVSPFLNLAHTRVETDASTETGGAAALHVADGSVNVSFSTLGARGQLNLADDFNLHGELGWQHAFGDITPSRTLNFVAGGPAFTEYGVPVAKNAGLGRIGLGWHHANIAVAADYEGLAGNGSKDQAAKVSVSVTF